MPILELREHVPVRSSEPLVETATDLWRLLRVGVGRAPGQTGWTLTAGSTVGFASVTHEGVRTSVRVLPKIDGLDVFFLADYAYGRRSPVRAPAANPALLRPEDRDPTAMLLLWFVRDVDAFATRWLRRDYRPRDLVLDAEVRGEVLFDRYVQEHLAVGDAVHVPVHVRERSLDTANNRLLKAGLRRASVLANQLPVPAARAAVKRAVAAAVPRFAQVTDVPVGPRLLRSVSVRGAQRHYVGVVRLTTDLLAGKLLGEEAHDTEVTAFTVDLPLLFQEALRGVLESFPAAVLEAARPRAQIVGPDGQVLSTSRVDPDYVLRRVDADRAPVLLLDAKYKRAVETAHEEGDAVTVAGRRLIVKRGDVYQAGAYRRHSAWLGSSVGLVYPVVVPAGGDAPQPHRVEGFDAPIHLLFLDVGAHARENLPAFHQQVESLLPGRRRPVGLASS